MFVGLVLIVTNKYFNILSMSNIYYGNIMDKILKGNIYNFFSYYKYYKLEIINNYLCSYYKHLELSSSIVKGIYVLKSLYLIDDLIGLILEKLKNIKVKIL